MRMQFINAALLSGVVLAVAMSPSVQAATYDYVGNPFTSIDSPSFGTSLDASVTFDSTVTSNFTGTASDLDITAFTISGAGSGLVLPSGSGYLINVGFTFSNGKITSWDFEAISDELGGIAAGTESYQYDGYSYVEDSINTYDNTYNAQNYNFGPAGTWTEVSAVPLPAALPMFGASIAGLVALAKRGRVRA